MQRALANDDSGTPPTVFSFTSTGRLVHGHVGCHDGGHDAAISRADVLRYRDCAREPRQPSQMSSILSHHPFGLDTQSRDLKQYGSSLH